MITRGGSELLARRKAAAVAALAQQKGRSQVSGRESFSQLELQLVKSNTPEETFASRQRLLRPLFHQSRPLWMGGGLAQAGRERGRQAAGRDWEAACRCSCCSDLLVAILDRLLACHGLPAAPAATKFHQNHWSMQSSKEILPRPELHTLPSIPQWETCPVSCLLPQSRAYF